MSGVKKHYLIDDLFPFQKGDSKFLKFSQFPNIIHMYNRSNDFIPYVPIDKAEALSLPKSEIHAYFSDKERAWKFEVIDNNDMSLISFNEGNLVYTLNQFNSYTQCYEVWRMLRNYHPEASISVHESLQDFLRKVHPELAQ